MVFLKVDGKRLNHSEKAVARKRAYTARAMADFGAWLGGTMAISEAAQRQAHRIQAHTGARLLAETSNSRFQRGRGRLPLERVPYPVDQAVAALANVENLILVGSKAPIGFFAYPGKPSKHYPESAAITVL